ncbi:MAG: protein-L-isoaspartate(D-aspartate) O-methyltransferase [Candidatus Latescibacter sp.]|nr:protein-L-isoaspartate(D-aspartate) O-methyltransferase [Candidatus Latescibacter sp.]
MSQREDRSSQLSVGKVNRSGHCLMLFLLVSLLFLSISCKSDSGSAETDSSRDEYTLLRQRMVDQQIEARGVRDQRVLEVMRRVPRHLFVPAADRDQAYEDHPLSIGLGQTISQPYIVGLMSELMQLKGSERVLEIGAGSGYQAAVLSGLAAEVYTIEIVRELAERAERILTELGCKNARVRWGDGYAGWPEKAPFAAIMVTAAADHIPQKLIDQLEIGGRLIIPVGNVSQDLLLCVKTPKGLTQKSIAPVLFVPMTGKIREEK